MPDAYVGTAGWQIPRTSADIFPAEGSTLQRYAARFPAVEINSSFHRPHKPQTYARWAAETPDHFRFSAKLPKTITHERRLVDAAEPLDRFLSEAGSLGPKLGPLIIQLPPKLAFDAEVASAFFKLCRTRTGGDLVCEPRHPSWFEPEPDQLLADFHVAQVAADPACTPAAADPGGWRGLRYWRLHGSPQMYRSPYTSDQLSALANRINSTATSAWIMFDNTMSGAATSDANSLATQL